MHHPQQTLIGCHTFVLEANQFAVGSTWPCRENRSGDFPFTALWRKIPLSSGWGGCSVPPLPEHRLHRCLAVGCRFNEQKTNNMIKPGLLNGRWFPSLAEDGTSRFIGSCKGNTILFIYCLPDRSSILIPFFSLIVRSWNPIGLWMIYLYMKLMVFNRMKK